MQEKFKSWGVIELFGHTRIAGEISEATIGGCQFVRIDVPEMNGKPGFTRFFGQNAIYSINPTSQEVATAIASNCSAQPVKSWDVLQLLPDKSCDDDNTDDEFPV